MTNKEVTPAQADKFWEAFNLRHPDIDMQLPPTRLLINGSIICNQPAKMPNEIYNIYFRFLKRWYMDNGYIEPENDLVYVATNDMKGMAIDTSKIVSINPVDMETTKVVFDDINDNNERKTVVIKENVDYFKKRVYIF
jgi:hypothetical protein